ncbi:hypothetical protein [Tautonia plasticadhaerens]|uniref:Acyltransferase n=1 Tax=Tautonia plasticadhaerens TaxID=2527974 RepID=A0A518HE10_9BACT|nr:hypothetical protein [Tautonia plasticadhaerens]QDV38946.1 hypothetical protein ElP_69060 [Tautonia plasticadhaerens]
MLAPRPPGPARMFALDMLRGLAMLLVLFTHLPGGRGSIAPVRLLNAIG